MRLAILVLVVAKNTRSLLSIASELAFRARFAIAGAKQAAEKAGKQVPQGLKPNVFSIIYGTTLVVP